MPILTVPTFSQQIQVVRQRILANRTDISTLPGSVTGDVFVVPQALSDVQMFAVIYYDSASHSVNDLLALENNAPLLALIATALNVTVAEVITDIGNSLNTLGQNVGVSRGQAQAANGLMSLLTVTPPTADIVVPQGTVARSSSGQTYTTTGPVTMYAANAISYYNPDLQAFVITAPAVATQVGSAGNTDAGTLTALVTPVPGLPLVDNLTPFVDGTDIQDDTDYGAQILLKWQALGAVTQAGIQFNVAQNANPGSQYLAIPGSAFAIRGPGKADLYIQNIVPAQYTETFAAFNSTQYADGIVPTNQPVIAAVSASSGTPYLVRDNSSATQHSVQARDTIRFSTPPTFPVTITYLVNQEVASSQNVFSSGQYAPYNYQEPLTLDAALATPLLVKEAPVLSVDYTATITVAPGYVKAQVITAVQANLAAFSAALVIGQQVFLSQVNAVVTSTPGVLRITGDPTKFAPTTSSGVVNSITPAANQYIVLANTNIF